MAFVQVPVKHHANPAGKKSNTPLSGVLRLMANLMSAQNKRVSPNKKQGKLTC
ncbi:hypothetical protein [Mangrovibacter phragmitis]|jgi:hypothetical protein|uniref:hypothetical protein n=1 Tax=Mangrovibacter phragmitis TaxID=1691903 RepID=UPI0012E850A6|nr:hypothetical protein [Mangrovibacter phragmitis]